MKKILFFSFMLSFILTACDKDSPTIPDDPNNPNSAVDIYVVGRATKGDGYSATLWKNGVPTTITDGTNYSEANAIAIDRNDIYVAGIERNSNYDIPDEDITKVWKNGKELYTFGNKYFFSLIGIGISGNNVYMATQALHEYNGTTVWKNGAVMYRLENFYSTSMIVYGNDVYMVGYEYSGDDAVYKNETRLYTLSDGTKDAIAIKGSDIYVAGIEINSNYERIAKIWKNGTVLYIIPNVEKLSPIMAIEGNDIYVAGVVKTQSDYKYVAKVWKNGIELYTIPCDPNATYVWSLGVVGKDVYTLFSEEPEVWKNDEKLYDLTVPYFLRSQPNSMVIVKK